MLSVNSLHDPDRETRAQARQLTGEQVTIDGGFNGYQDLGLHTHWLPIIPTTTSAEKSTIPVHKYELALPRPFRSHAALLRRSPSPSIALAAPGSGRAARPPPQIATVGGGRGACIPRCKEFSLVHFVETVGPAAGSPRVRQGPPTSPPLPSVSNSAQSDHGPRVRTSCRRLCPVRRLTCREPGHCQARSGPPSARRRSAPAPADRVR
jgi:hypothetical protein